MIKKIRDKWRELDKLEQNSILGRITGLGLWIAFSANILFTFYEGLQIISSLDYSAIEAATVAELTYLNSMMMLGIFSFFVIRYMADLLDLAGKTAFARIYDRIRGVE